MLAGVVFLLPFVSLEGLVSSVASFVSTSGQLVRALLLTDLLQNTDCDILRFLHCF
jgi:hypothetical protein